MAAMANIQLASENAIIVYFNGQASPVLSQTIAFYQKQINQLLTQYVIDVLPAYTSLMITYRVSKVQYEAFCAMVQEVIDQHPFKPTLNNSETIEIPVWYDQQVGLDLDKVLSEKQLTLEKLIALHTEKTYCVYAIGFSPAFAFLGHLAPALQQARHATPRLKVPAGSVGIANDQTAVYPIESPGGWHIIGKTPWDLSLDNAENLNRFQVGQQVRFKSIDAITFKQLASQQLGAKQ